MVTITLPVDQIKDALIEGVRSLIGSLGETIIYKHHDGTPDQSVRAVRTRLSMEELIGDFQQGDVRFTIDATTVSSPPAKYDEIVAGDGKTYKIIEYLSVDIGIDNTVLVYKPVGRA